MKIIITILILLISLTIFSCGRKEKRNKTDLVERTKMVIAQAQAENSDEEKMLAIWQESVQSCAAETSYGKLIQCLTLAANPKCQEKFTDNSGLAKKCNTFFATISERNYRKNKN